MVFPKEFEEKVGFTSIRQMVIEKCETRLGKELASSMSFSNDRQDIMRKLNCVSEMKQLLTSSVSFPDGQVYDILPMIKSVQILGSYISSENLHYCSVTFETMRRFHDFFSAESEHRTFTRQLREEFKEIPDFSEIEKQINRSIDRTGEVKDSASPELSEIRKTINSIAGSMHRIISNIIEDSIKKGFVDREVSPAIRDGHMVIPVSSGHKKNINGILHDTSATGKTVFIEPAEVVQAGNRMRELKMEEEREIIRILTLLTDIIRPYSEEIEFGCRLLAKMDFIKSKAKTAIETDGQLPVIEKEPEIDWFHAVHPGLLMSLRKQGRDVVPLNLNLNNKKRILIISGPNAGGKSVTLKTIGTVQYMMQCGMLPTLYSNSHMGIFRNIFIDIGDEQSMENDLSTYSSHLSNMKYFLEHADKSTLFLADEMGSGTEPQIGAALAQSVLTQLGQTGCFGIITTHYQNLKILAETEEGFINGAMLYDRQHLRPTFQLSTGHPGSSFALEIARNIGLPSSVVDMAKEIVGTDYVNSEKFLLDIQRDRRYWNNKRQDIKEKEARLNKLLEEYEDKASELKSQRATIIKNAREEAKTILAGANKQIERSIHEIRKSQADKEQAKQIRKELEEYKKSLESDHSDKLPDPLKPLRHKSRKKTPAGHNQTNEAKNNKLKEGDYVKMKNGGVVGRIVSIDGENAEVIFGNFRSKVDISKLESSSKPKETKGDTIITTSDSQSGGSRQRQLDFKTDIDLRGMRAEDALQAVTYFLDDALQFNIRRVRILHGTGHGILKTLIRDFLKSNSAVKSYHDEDIRFGGAGITVVDME